MLQVKEIKIVTVSEEDKISRPVTPIELEKYPDIDPERAWELANLIRIAGTDYQCFNDWFNNNGGCKEFILEEGRDLEGVEFKNSWIYAERKITETTLEKYILLTKEAKNSNIEQRFPDNAYYKYKILKTYEFVSYYPTQLEVDIDRFGFIAERQEGDKKIIFVVFRGTREPSEWFSNLQFKQVNFLETESNPQGIEGCGKVSLGFNKMYTEFRPGILIEKSWINKVSRSLDSRVRDTIEKINKFKSEEQPIHQAIKDFYENTSFGNTDIYVTGHSLGGALATIATMDIVTTDLNPQRGQSKLSSPIHLYTFASPRVGDNLFANKFNELVSERKIKALRFANSEDLVTNVPFSVWFKSDINLEKKFFLSLARATFNQVTGEIFNKDYQHVGTPVYFTHQALRYQEDGGKGLTATIGDNHNMTSTYCGALKRSSS